MTIYEAVMKIPVALFCRHGMTHSDDTGGRLRARLWGDETVVVQFPCGCTVPVKKEDVERIEAVLEDEDKEHIPPPIISQPSEHS